VIYLALGRRETGKTTLAYFLVRKCKSRVVFDPRGLIPAPAGRARSLDDISDAFDKLAGDSGADVVITPDGDVQACFERMSAEIRSWLHDDDDAPRPALGVLVDELRFVDTKAPAFDWLLRCATRASLSIVLTAHRPADVPPDIRAIADVWLIFKTTQEHDLKVLSERCDPSVAAIGQRLIDRQFVAWDDTRGKATTYTKPIAWYVPLKNPRENDSLTRILDA
jgi:hypothetical protein